MRLGNIEILRGLAALWVVGLHAEGFIVSRGFELPFGGFFQIGGAGVDLFFVISGFVITLSILEGKRGVLDFVVARLIRIVPAYWTITALTCIIALIALAFGLPSEAFRELNWDWFFSSLFFVSQPLLLTQPLVYQGWTLEYEMLFYLIVAISTALFRSKWLGLIFASVIVFLAVLGLDWVDWVALEFVFGVFAAFIFRKFEAQLATSVVLIVVSISSIVFIQSSHPDMDRWMGFGLPFAFLVLGVASLKQVKHPIAMAFGRDSYAVYLVQVLTIPILGQLLFVSGLVSFSAVGAFALILLSTQVAGLLFETQFDGKVRAWLQSKWRQSRAIR